MERKTRIKILLTLVAFLLPLIAILPGFRTVFAGGLSLTTIFLMIICWIYPAMILVYEYTAEAPERT